MTNTFKRLEALLTARLPAELEKNACHYLMAWYTAWGGGLGQYANWAWRIGASHVHQGYQNPVASYALSTAEGGLIPNSSTARSDWEQALKRQLELYTWLLSSEGAVAGGATNSWNGSYSAYPQNVSTFYGMAYTEAPVYHDPPSNNWFGMQVWPLERVAELYYIFAEKGDKSSENFQMAKHVIEKWIAYSLDYVFVGERPVTDEEGYYLNEAGERVLGGQNPQIAVQSDPGEFWIPANLEWSGQPDPWKGFDSFTGNPGLHVTTKNPSQDVGVLGSYIKTLVFFAAGTKAETGGFTALGNKAKKTWQKNCLMQHGINDGIGIAAEEEHEDYIRYFTKEVYFPNGWSGKTGRATPFLVPTLCRLIRQRAVTASISVMPTSVRKLKTIRCGLIWKINIRPRGIRIQANGKTVCRLLCITASGLRSIWRQLTLSMTV